MEERDDAYGRLVLDWLDGKRPNEIVERDNGFITAYGGPDEYFAPLRRWPAVERRALRLVRGRVLDVGVGAGRVALELQRRGHDVTGIDVSPLAVDVARRRGVQDARVLALAEVDRSLGAFDTVVMYGNNLGLLGRRRAAAKLLRRLAAVTTGRGRILAAGLDPYSTDDPEHLAYHERNRARGRMGGQLRIRIRYRSYATPWFDYLLASPDEVRELAATTEWALARVVADDGPLYVAVLEKAA